MQIIKNVPPKNIFPLINKKWLFLGLWKLKGRKAEGEKILSGLLKRSGEFGLEPKIIYVSYGEFILLAATIGKKMKSFADKKYRAGEYADYFYITGLASALAEALTEYGHKLICKRFGYKYLKTIRISPGYPSWPDLKDQRKIARVLNLKKIGVTVSKSCQLVPEYSTTSVIVRI